MDIVERVARVLFCLDGDWCSPDDAYTNPTVNYWFRCKPTDTGEDRDCWAHCEEKRNQARAALAAMLEAVGEPVAYLETSPSGSVRQLSYKPGNLDADELAVGWTETPLYSLAALREAPPPPPQD